MTVSKIGIDIGALFVKVVRINGEVSKADYRHHLGKPVATLKEILTELPAGEYKVGVTGTGAELFTTGVGIEPVNFIEAEIATVLRSFPVTRNILNVGGGSATLISLDQRGNFLNYSSNSLCAAGTGSFLDEQARRLEITYEDMAGFKFDKVPPSIASRCAVFAKSDLIHRQQEGYSKSAMWAGLCKGCVDTFLQTLLKGKPLEGQTIVTGGVSRNKQIIQQLHNYYGDMIRTWDKAHLAGAMGAAMLAEGQTFTLDHLLSVESRDAMGGEASVNRGAPLVLNKSDYPSFEVHSEYTDEMGNEVRLWEEVAGEHSVYIGIDIGSTSTKLVVLGRDERVLLDIYRKTLGDPLGAVKKLFVAIENLAESNGSKFNVLGCGTTGSGRKFVGKVIGADQVINEISAHVAGAMATDPSIDTIFEIGGQDSKYMRTVNGAIRDANMNFICAAGTGSFVEEQAAKLGFSVSEIGEAVMGIAPPETSDRCTVFMEEDTNKLLRQGYSSLEAVAAVLNSVVKNYLNKVVGNRHVSKRKIFFQGATARNKGLVAAFENLLDVEVVVSPLCHQMGSYGVALLTAAMMQKEGETSTFRGFDLSRRNIELSQEPCDGCNNNCRITFASIEGEAERPSWGYMCGKDPDDDKPKVNRNFRLFRKRNRLLKKRYNNQELPQNAPTVGIPMSLSLYSYLPFWTAFFNNLGWRVKITRETDEALKIKGTQNSSGDFCFPAKVAIGHALEAVEDSTYDRIMIPQTISNVPNEKTSNSHFCPYVQSYGSVIKSIFNLQHIPTDNLLSPVLDFRWDRARMHREFMDSVGKNLGVKKREMKKAIEEAFTAQSEFDQGCRIEGGKALSEIAESGEKAIVVVGRPYNCFDKGANLGLPEKISEYGYQVVPVDFVPFEPKKLGEEFSNIFWNYGQRIMGAIKMVSKSPNLFPVYLSNFNCGPDSFLLTYAEKLMGQRPLLILELDEHGADAGYLTRVEAFLDVVSKFEGGQPGRVAPQAKATVDEFKKRTLWVPAMHPYASEFAASVFTSHGYKAFALPQEDRETFEIGRAAVRGSECLPTSLTIGGLLRKLKELNAVGSEHAFFMATASGPCRFGQYALLDRLILDRHGYEDVLIMTPSSYNSYQGLEEKIRRELWYSFLAADVVQKMECKVRPYEVNAGETNRVAALAAEKINEAFKTRASLEPVIRDVAGDFAKIERVTGAKPLVGIVGEIYVRCNPYSNGYVIEHIEKYGGEAWLAPLSEWILYTAHLQEWAAKQQVRNLAARGRSLLKNKFLFSWEHKVYQWCKDVLADRYEPPIKDVVEEGEKFMPINFEGESILTVGRTVQFIKQGADLVVNCAPFGCMPGTLTSSIFQQIEKEMGVPVVNMYYDGEGEINKRLQVYIHQAFGGDKDKQKRQLSPRNLGYTG